MPLHIQTSKGLLVVSDLAMEAVVQHAHRIADLTAATLDATGLFPEKPTYWPVGFLLELGAVLELGLWERQGLRGYLNTDLPTFAEAAAALATRATKGPQEFAGPRAAPLSSRVFHIWMEQFAWQGSHMLGAEIVLGQLDEDQFADVLADFVWQHRHELAQFLTNEQATNPRETA
jgi:hypothetical protein